jgi:hypothetical protein
MKEIGNLEQYADSTSTSVRLSFCNKRNFGDRVVMYLLQPLRLKWRKFRIKIYVKDLIIYDLKLIDYCTRNGETECVGTQRNTSLTVKKEV